MSENNKNKIEKNNEMHVQGSNGSPEISPREKEESTIHDKGPENMPGEEKEKILPGDWIGRFTVCTAVQYCLLVVGILISMAGLSFLMKAFSQLNIVLPLPTIWIMKGYFLIAAGVIALTLFVARARGGSFISFVLSILAQFFFAVLASIVLIGITLPIAQFFGLCL